MLKAKKGFTLIEILIVIAIIGILVSIVLVNFSAKVKLKAHDAEEISNLKQLEAAIKAYYYNHGEYPRMIGGGPNNCPNEGFGYCIDWMSSDTNTEFINNLQYEGYITAESVCRMFGANCPQGAAPTYFFDENLRDAIYLTTIDHKTDFKMMAILYDKKEMENDGGTMPGYYEVGSDVSKITVEDNFGYIWNK